MATKSKKQSKLKKLLFVDTNIWLDFYRARNEAGLALLNHLDQLRDSIIVTQQLEMEFKKNRLTAILEGMQQLKTPEKTVRPGLFSDAKAVQKIARAIKEIEGHNKKLQGRLARVVSDPTHHDPVYKVCQRLFHRESSLVLGKDHEEMANIRGLALERFHLGCPPRKKSDTSIGDSINWEWMIACADRETAELVIVSRDGDYGQDFDDVTYLNDHLKQEFSERVSKKRTVLLYKRLSDALKHFQVEVSDAEVNEEQAVIEQSATQAIGTAQGLARSNLAFFASPEFSDHRKAILEAIEIIREQTQQDALRARAFIEEQLRAQRVPLPLSTPEAGSGEGEGRSSTEKPIKPP
jgi:PIN domain